MISYRYHAVSIAAVFLALAVGVILGAGPLEHTIGSVASASSTAAENTRLKALNDSLNERVAADTTFATKMVPVLVGGSLANRSAVLVIFPGVAPATVATTLATLRAAGASVTGTVTLTSASLATNKQSVLNGIVSRLAPSGVSIPSQSSTIDQVTSVLAATLVTNSATKPSKEQVAQGKTLLSALAQVGAVTVSGNPQNKSATAFVLVPSTSSSAGLGAALGHWLAADSHAAVVAGSTGSANVGPVAVLRGPTSPSHAAVTVDDVETAQGQTALALGAAAAIAGTSGAYGTGAGAVAPYPTR